MYFFSVVLLVVDSTSLRTTLRLWRTCSVVYGITELAMPRSGHYWSLTNSLLLYHLLHTCLVICYLLPMQSLSVLEHVKNTTNVITKTSLMLGCGERLAEVESTLKDLKAAGCDVVTFGQYIRPSRRHMPMKVIFKRRQSYISLCCLCTMNSKC